MGPSGGGKIKTIGLIECFCDPEKGLNEYEDNPLTQLNVQWYRD